MRITISGPPSSGKSTVASLLSKKLGLETISGGNIFRELATKKNMTLDEFTRYVQNNKEIDNELDELLLKKAKSMDDVVLESRLIGWLTFLNDVFSYRFFITAPIDIRIKRIFKREGGDIKELKWLTKDRQKSEFERYSKLYDIDLEDVSIYDLVIDSSSISPEKIVDKIAQSVYNNAD